MRVQLGDQSVMFDGQTEELRWFLLPSEALLWLQDPKQAASRSTHKCPFDPVIYSKPGATPSPRNLLSMDVIRDKAHILPEKIIPTAFKELLLKTLESGFHGEIESVTDTNHPSMNVPTKEDNLEDHGITAPPCESTDNHKEESKLKDNSTSNDDQTLGKALEEKFEKDNRLVSDKSAVVCPEEAFLMPRPETHDNTEVKESPVKHQSHPPTKNIFKLFHNLISDKSTVVCPEEACLMPRPETHDNTEVKESPVKHQWHSPTNNIFKPTVQVCLKTQPQMKADLLGQ